MSKSVLKGLILLPNIGDGSYGSKVRFILTESVGKDDRTAMTRLREDLLQGVKDIDDLLKHCDADGRCKDRDLQP